MSIKDKLNALIEATQRMRRDAERVRERIEKLRGSTSRESIEDIEKRLWEIDDINAELCAIIAFLSSIQAMLYSGEYSSELFELAKMKKNEFSFQVSNLLSYYKTVAFAIQEMSKTTRIIYEYHTKLDILRQNITMTKE